MQESKPVVRFQLVEANEEWTKQRPTEFVMRQELFAWQGWLLLYFALQAVPRVWRRTERTLYFVDWEECQAAVLDAENLVATQVVATEYFRVWLERQGALRALRERRDEGWDRLWASLKEFLEQAVLQLAEEPGGALVREQGLVRLQLVAHLLWVLGEGTLAAHMTARLLLPLSLPELAPLGTFQAGVEGLREQQLLGVDDQREEGLIIELL